MRRVLVVGEPASFRLLYTLHFYKLGYAPIPIGDYPAALAMLEGARENAIVFVRAPHDHDGAHALITHVCQQYPRAAVLASIPLADNLDAVRARLPDAVRACFHAPESHLALATHLQEAGLFPQNGS